MKIRGRIRKEVSRFNGFRKFFNTNLIRAKVNPAVKEMLMGHSIDLDDNYYRPSADEILKEYLKAAKGVVEEGELSFLLSSEPIFSSKASHKMLRATRTAHFTSISKPSL